MQQLCIKYLKMTELIVCFGELCHFTAYSCS